MRNDPYGTPRLLSRPVRVHWLGWETDTYRLQQAGWELSVEESFERNTMRLAINHPRARVQGISTRASWDYYGMSYREPFMDERPEAVLEMRHMGREVLIEHSMGPSMDFHPIDAQPSFTTNQMSRLEDLAHFQPALVRSSKLIVLSDASVDQLLERALELQEPAKQAYFTENVRKDRQGGLILPEHDFRCSIVSLREAA